MKKPEFGSNAKQSFIDFFTGSHTIRIGIGEGRFFYKVIGPEGDQDNDMGDVSYRQTDNVFGGTVNLSRELTHYSNFNLEDDIEITHDTSVSPITGGYAELGIIGDGAHAVTFDSSYLKTPNSEDFDNTLGTLNKIGIYYDGEYYYYTVSVFNLAS